MTIADVSTILNVQEPIPIRSETESQIVYFQELIYKTVSSSAFISAMTPTLAPALCTVLQPTIQSIIQNSIKRFLETVVQQTIVPLQEKIANQEKVIEKQNSQITELNEKVCLLSSNIEKVSVQVEEQEQYSRRTCLRFHNIPPTTTDTDIHGISSGTS